MSGGIDRRNMKVRSHGFQFRPFRPTEDGQPLADVGLADDEGLLVFGRKDEYRGT